MKPMAARGELGQEMAMIDPSATPASTATAAPSSRFFTAQRLRLHYLDWGNEGAPLLILLHGGRDHAHSWDWLAPRLSARWHVVAPDLRGHGDSDWANDGNYLSPYMVLDLAELVRHLGVDRVAIVGHSLGGNIALRFTGLYPDMVNRLVAIEGLGLATHAEVNMGDKWRKWIEDRRAVGHRVMSPYPDFEAALARMQAANPHLDAARAHHLTLHGIRPSPDGGYVWKYDPYMRLVRPYDLPDADEQALWAAINCPVLLVWGEESWASNPATDGRAGYFQDARVLSVPGAGHWVHHDGFELFAREVAAFLAEGEA